MRSVRTFKTFLAVVKHGSFAAAGHEIGLTSAAIGLQMRGLEEELKQPLFDRTARTVVLNAAGRKLVSAIEDLVLRYEALAAGTENDELSGTVVMGALISALMGSFADALWTIKKEYPRLEVRLLAGQSDDFTRKVEQGQLDAAVVVRSPNALPSSLIWTPLYRESMVLITPRHPHFDLPADPLEILQSCPFIRFDRNAWTGYLVSEVLRQCNAVPTDAMELNSFEAIMEIVRQGFGVSIVPKLANVDWSKDRGLKIIPLLGVAIERDVGLMERSSHLRIGFTDAIKQYFIDNLGRLRR